MQNYINSVTSTNGDAVAGASVTVLNSDGTVPTLYAANGSSPLASNVITTDSTGEFSFYAANGTYTITVTSLNFSGQSNSGIVLYDPADVTGIVLGDPTGVTDSLAAFTTAFASSYAVTIPQVVTSYKLSANWTPPAGDMSFRAAGNVRFTVSHPDLKNYIPYESSPGPIWSQDLISKTYGPEWAGQGNIFQSASYAKANLATVPVVAHYAQGEAAAAGSKAWGTNPAAVVSNATGTGIGAEVDIVMLAAGTGYGINVASSGTFQPQNALQIDANQSTCRYLDGIVLHFSETSSRGCLTNAGFKLAGGSGAASVCQNFFLASGVKATSLEVDLPSFAVSATPAGSSFNRLRAVGRASGTSAELQADGDTNAGLVVRANPAGTGHVFITDPTLNAVIDVGPSSTLGLFNKTPVGQSTGWGTPTGAAITTNFPGATATLLQTSQTLAALLAYLKSRGDLGA